MNKIATLVPGLLLSFPLHAQISDGIDSVFNWDDPSIVGSMVYDNSYNEIWGFVSNGREFGVIGSTKGTHIFDLSNTDSVYEAAYVAGRVQGIQIIHRDYHDYQGYLYVVADEGVSSLQIIDLQYLPDSVQLVYDSDSLVMTSHNIFIDSATAHLYVCSKSGATGPPFTAMTVYSLTNPVDPGWLYDYTDVGHVHDVFVRKDTAYIHAGPQGMRVVDFTAIPGGHTVLGSLTIYPDQAYNHSGWLSEDGSIYAFADEAHGMDVKICDVTDLSDIKVISQINSGFHDSSMAHNLIFKGDYLYIAYYHDGLQIYNLSDPANPVRTGYYDTYLKTDHTSFRGAWGVYPFLSSGRILISDMQTGFYVVDATEAINKPLAAFDYWCDNLQVTFTDMSSNPDSWQWDFDNNGVIDDTAQHPIMIYEDYGTYEACLAVSNVNGSDTMCRTINLLAWGTRQYGSAQLFEVQPNPFRDEIWIKSQLPLDDIPVRIYNVYGMLMYTAQLNSTLKGQRLDLAMLPRGTYFLHFPTLGDGRVQKLVKLR